MDEPPDRSSYRFFELLLSITVSIVLQYSRLRVLRRSCFAHGTVPSVYQLC